MLAAMPDWSLWLPFALTQLLFALTPGPAVLLVMSQAMTRGTRAGVAAGLGVQAGNGVYLTLSVIGLGAILATSQTLFEIVKYAGAAYLVWMGIQTLRSAKAAAQGERKPVTLWSAPFTQGFVKQLANPKSVLFFGSLLPQFLDPGRDLAVQSVALGLTCAVIEVPILAVYAAAAARGGKLLKGRGIVWRERLSGLALIAVGGVLATMRRAD